MNDHVFEWQKGYRVSKWVILAHVTFYFLRRIAIVAILVFNNEFFWG